jgi:hypothetical protein
MSSSDFWNLAGRAGRLTKEFQGNIICIDPSDWPVSATYQSKQYLIRKSLDKISDTHTELIDFIRLHLINEEAGNERYEYAFSYYYMSYLMGEGKIRTSSNLSLEKVAEIERVCHEATKLITIPVEIILKNPGVSPLRQQRLFNRLTERLSAPDELTLVNPLNENAPERYTQIATRAYKYLYPNYVTTMSGWLSYIAPLSVYWMRGSRLPIMINFNTKSKYNEGKPLSVVIRNTMHILEEDIRFTFAKYISCYSDLLDYLFTTKNIENEPVDIRALIEFGVSDKTLVSLISLGFDRDVAIAISAYCLNRSLTEDEVESWLLETDFGLLKLNEESRLQLQKIKKNLSGV